MASTEDLEVARILRMLPHLVWEAQHPPPCTHGLRWGSRKRRSAGHVESCPVLARSPAASPSPRAQLHHPAAPAPDSSSAKTESMAPVAESSSPGTPLEFFPSSEDSKPAAKRRRRGERRSNGKKPKSNGREVNSKIDTPLVERLQLLIHERTELQKEAAEARDRLEAERWRYSELVELRTKLEERRHRRHGQPQPQLLCGRSRFDPAPTGALRPIPQAHGHAQQRPGPLWSDQWMSAFPVLSQLPTTGFALCLPPSSDRLNAAAGAGEVNHGEWTGSRPLGLGGGQNGARPCVIIPDLNAGADEAQSWC